MNLDQALAFVGFAVVAAITPGPSNVMLTATGANVGIARGLPCLLGVAAGMGLMMSVVALGLGALLLNSPLAAFALKWLGATFLLWLSFKIAVADNDDSTYSGAPIGFVGAALFQWLNPKSWLVSTSAVSTFLRGDEASALAQAIAFGGLFVAATLPSGFIWLAAGVGVRRWLNSPRRLRAFNLSMGATLAASVIAIVW